MKQITKLVLGASLAFAPRRLQTFVKEKTELMYWKRIFRASGEVFYNRHFEKNYTDLFGIDRSYYDGKRLLDIGCGPAGSLEWACEAAERIGVDTLADDYRKMNRGTHKMRYVAAGAESLPFESDYFDVVAMFNSLDHVENVEMAAGEAVRVLKPGGDLLLIAEINHRPTLTEPHVLRVSVTDFFKNCSILEKKIFAINKNHDIYASINEEKSPVDPDNPAILCVRLSKSSC